MQKYLTITILIFLLLTGCSSIESIKQSVETEKPAIGASTEPISLKK